MAHLSDLIVNGSARIVNSLVANTLKGDGSSITNINASNISSGSLDLARLTSTATKNSFLYVSSENGTPSWTTVDSSTVGLGNVTNNKQVKGLASGTTSGHIVTWGSDGYTVTDSGFTLSNDNFETTPSATVIPTQNAIKNYLGTYFSANDAMVFKGTIATSGGNVATLPNTTASAGWTYRFKEAGYIYTDGTFTTTASDGKTLIGKVEIGDMIICITDGSKDTAATWSIIQTNIDGAVIGPTSSTSGYIPIYADDTGKLLGTGKSIATSISSTSDNTSIPSSNVVYNFVNSNYLSLGGGTMTGALTVSTATFTPTAGKDSTLSAGTSKLYKNALVISNPGTANDVGWIRVVGSSETDTVLEIATGDDASQEAGATTREEIYVRQYTTSSTVAVEAKLLDKSGNTLFPGTVTSTGGFSGNLTGNITGSKTGGCAGQLLYQSAANTTSFLAAPAANKVLVATTANTPAWGNVTNAMLSNSSVELGSQTLTLGAAATTTVTGMDSITSTTLSATSCVNSPRINMNSTTQYIYYNTTTGSIDIVC